MPPLAFSLFKPRHAPQVTRFDALVASVLLLVSSVLLLLFAHKVSIVAPMDPAPLRPICVRQFWTAMHQMLSVVRTEAVEPMPSHAQLEEHALQDTFAVPTLSVPSHWHDALKQRQRVH